MKSPVMIKGNKYGFSIVLDPELPFEVVLEETKSKFRESARFFGKAGAMAVSFSGRDLDDEEQDRMVTAIEEAAGLSIPYLIDGDEITQTRFARLLETVSGQTAGTAEENEPAVEPASQPAPVNKAEPVIEPRPAGEPEAAAEAVSEPEPEAETVPVPMAATELRPDLVGRHAQFYRGILRSGQTIKADGSIVIVGDINPGAQVIAGGDVVILGCLKGTVYAGYPDDWDAIVAALIMDPMQIQIGSRIARAPDQKVKKKPGRKKAVKPEIEPKMAFIDQGNIFIEPITRALINEISTR
ncbi:MAG: hypothetical protein IJH71_07610 [Eubacterium sp.]|nr:hypothetical protein [Eubacterium sp.]